MTHCFSAINKHLHLARHFLLNASLKHLNNAQCARHGDQKKFCSEGQALALSKAVNSSTFPPISPHVLDTHCAPQAGVRVLNTSDWDALRVSSLQCPMNPDFFLLVNVPGLGY